MSSALITLGNQTFNLGTSMADSMRRREYFAQSGSAQLTDDEKRILSSLGIDEIMMTRLRHDLPTFFDKLPDCQNDAKLILSTECEIPYFVVWTTLFKNKIATDERLIENAKTHPPVSNIETAMHEKMLNGLRPYMPDIYDELFTQFDTSSPVDSNEHIKRIFSLIFLNDKL